MRLNFYFEWPFYDVEGEQLLPTSNYTHLITSAKLYKLCKETHPEIEIKAINTYSLNWHGEVGTNPYHCPACKFTHFFLIIENPDTKKYFLISYWDKLREVNHGTFWDLENCVEIFTSDGVQANEIDFSSILTPYTPTSYMSLYKQTEARIEEVFRNPKITPERLFFRGTKYGIREYLAENEKRIYIDDYKVSPETFIDEIAPYSINIDINGAAEVSCRTFDIMGLQSALIRPKLNVKFHNELIPDYHYAALKCDDLGNWKDVGDAYIERFEDLKKDPELVKFLSENGRKWYEENATMNAHVNILKKLLDFNKLK
jgi:hypothetical protein